MSDVVIQVDRLWKKYRLGVLGTGTLRHDFNRWLPPLVPELAEPSRMLHAFRQNLKASFPASSSKRRAPGSTLLAPLHPALAPMA
jgi:hypothetical protein